MFERVPQKHTKETATNMQQAPPSGEPIQSFATKVLKSVKLLMGTEKPFKCAQKSSVTAGTLEYTILAEQPRGVTRYFT